MRSSTTAAMAASSGSSRDTSIPDLPVKDHKARILSGERGVSLAFSVAPVFFGEHGIQRDDGVRLQEEGE